MPGCVPDGGAIGTDADVGWLSVSCRLILATIPLNLSCQSIMDGSCRPAVGNNEIFVIINRLAVYANQLL